MGKATGFLDYSRLDTPVKPPAQRVKNWEEFHLPLPQMQRKEQGSRCMNCGVPFCQAGMELDGSTLGCPLHNLIPEWNDMIHWENSAHALARLLKTNHFPDLPRRVCPPPC